MTNFSRIINIHNYEKADRNGLPAQFSGDGVHPNKEGYAIMQPIVENAIARALLMWGR